MKLWPFRAKMETKDNPVGSIFSAWRVGQPQWTPRQYDRMAEESYVRNAVAYKCVKLISTNAAMVPWILSDKKGKEIEAHPLLDLLKRPAPMVGGHALFEAIYAYLLLAGNSYFVTPDMRANRPPNELWTMRPDRVKAVPGPFGVPKAFEYETDGQSRTLQVDPRTGAGQVLQIKEFHPLNDWYGLSRVDPAATAIDRHNAASGHNKALLDNGARPTGALIFKPVKNADGSEQSAPQQVIEAAEKELQREHGGPKGAGKPLVFGGNVDWQEMGISPRDMDFAKGKEDAARDICTAFGVPHILIVPGNSTYNNLSEAKLELWEETILPLIDRVVDDLDAWLTPRFGDGLRLGVDLDGVSALEPRRDVKRKSIVELFEKGLIDGDEARQALDWGPRPAGAVKLSRGEGPVVAAFVNGAVANPAMVEVLYNYLVSVGLLDGKKRSFEDFMAQWDGMGDVSPSARMAALGIPADTPQNTLQGDPAKGT